MRGKKGAVPIEGKDSAAVPSAASELVTKRRRLVADYCRLMGEHLTGRPAGIGAAPAPPAPEIKDPAAGLPPRVRQTLLRLLAGDSEKQIAAHLGISRHTIHVYVKAIYRHFQASSRGELLARFVDPASLKPPQNP